MLSFMELHPMLRASSLHPSSFTFFDAQWLPLRDIMLAGEVYRHAHRVRLSNNSREHGTVAVEEFDARGL
jgi:hypothetical protein